MLFLEQSSCFPPLGTYDMKATFPFPALTSLRCRYRSPVAAVAVVATTVAVVQPVSQLHEHLPVDGGGRQRFPARSLLAERAAKIETASQHRMERTGHLINLPIDEPTGCGLIPFLSLHLLTTYLTSAQKPWNSMLQDSKHSPVSWSDAKQWEGAEIPRRLGIVLCSSEGFLRECREPEDLRKATSHPKAPH